ncbi:hypothetical protein QQZ08_011787 [Neonectria magnoliae]|uniref:Uncharacterized protein n=1 Tax=Neonectria magnoliae TaxID=2732573 RepID=A0ABR1H7W1_9HYPO
MTQIHPSTEPQAEHRAQSEHVMAFLDMRGNAELSDGLRSSIEPDADAGAETAAKVKAETEPARDVLDRGASPHSASGPTPGAAPAQSPGSTPARSRANTPASRYPDSAINRGGGQERTVHQLIVEYRWPTLATGFLSQIPQNNGDWENRNFSPDLVNDVANMFRLTHLPPGFCPKTDWPRFFTAALMQLAGLKFIPSAASLFSIVLVATCHIAVVEGCNMDVIDTTLRTCLILRGIPQAYITPEDLVDLRLGVLNGIDLLDECVSALGPRANEFPLYFTDCLFLFQNCTPRCFDYLLSFVTSICRPTHNITASRNLGVPALVFQLLGGQGSSWDYDEISGILRFNGEACPLCEVPEPACCDNLEELMAEYPERRRGYAPPMAPQVRPGCA